MYSSIVIAVYNEEKNVKELTERIYTSMKKLKNGFELIYVVDGEDGTYEILKNMQKKHKNLILLHSLKPTGFANAFKKGFNEVNPKATYVLTMDGDLNHQPEEIHKLIEKIEQTNSDIVIGSRYIEKGKIEKLSFSRKFISLFSNFIIDIFWNQKIKDKTSGFRLYKKNVIDRIFPLCESKGFEFLFEILILSSTFKYKIKEVPIVFKAREDGKSKFNLWKTAGSYAGLIFVRPFKKKIRKPITTKYVTDKRVSLILNNLQNLNKEELKILDVGCDNKYVTNIIKNKRYNIMGIDKFIYKKGVKDTKWIKNKLKQY